MDALPPAIRKIATLLGLKPAQALQLMPGGDDSTQGYPGIMLSPDDDDETWAEREHKRDIEEFQRGYRNQ
jgi:hypothetical protein